MTSILTANRGCILTLQELAESNDHNQDEDKRGTKHSVSQSKLVGYSYKSSKTKFVKSTDQELNIAANQVITCRNVEDFISGTIQTCLLVEVHRDSNHHKSSSKLRDGETGGFNEYQVLFLQDGSKIRESGSFSCTSLLSQWSVWLLNGPTICWEDSGKLFIAKATCDDPSVYIVEHLPQHLWSLGTRFKWCTATKEHLLFIATSQSKCSTSSTHWFDDSDSERWITLRCPRFDIKNGEIINEFSAIPHPYARIVMSISISTIYADQAATSCKSVLPLPTDAVVLAATTQGQLLSFNGGRIQMVCDLPFRDPCEIVVVYRCDGEDLVVVKSKSGSVCAVGRTSFQVI